MQRNNYIVGRAFRNFLLASILTNIVQQLRVLMDGVIVGHLIGPMALSAISLYLPLEEINYALIMLFTVGAGFIAARRQSQRDHVGVSNQFSVALSSTLGMVVTVVALSFVFFPSLIQLLADEETTELYDLTASYTKIMLISFLIQVPNSILRTFISIDGQPQLVTRSIIVSFVLNLVMDVVFVGFLNMGIEGAAWATLISDTVGMFMLLPYATGRSCSFTLIDVANYMEEQKLSLQEGFPLAIGELLAGVVVMITNQVVLSFEGANGVFIVAVIFQILSICGMVTEGLSEINESVGGVLLGEKDNTSFRVLVHKCYKLLWGFLIMVFFLIFLFPSHFLMFFGAELEQISPANLLAVRVAGLMLIPYIMASFNASVHALVGYDLLSTGILLLQSAAIIGMPFVVTAMDERLFWWAFPISSLLTVLLQMGVSFCIHKRKGCSTELALLPTLPDQVSMDYSIAYDDATLDEGLKDAGSFLNVCELDVWQRADLFGCCTEIAYNILAHSTDNHKGHYFDLRIQDEEESLTIWFKDAGKPYHPAQRIMVPDKVNMTHKYMFGLNVTTLIVKK